MFKKIINKIGGDPNKKAIDAYALIVDEINNLEPEYEALSNEALAEKTAIFKNRLASGETLEEIAYEAFATIRETSKRVLGLRHYDVQMIGGLILHNGEVAEMRTGEGKTLMSTLPIYLNALSEKGVHLITVNDYLARRDARWMAPIFDFLGLSIGVLQMGSRTENSKKAFLIDLKAESQKEDQHQLVLVDRKLAYEADITYGTNSEFGFDYLRDNMTLQLEARVQTGHHFAIIDEIDNVLIDEARTPLIISGPSHDDTENYLRMTKVVKQLKQIDFEINEKDRTVTLTELGESKVEQLLGMPLRDPDRPEDVTPDQARQIGFLEQSLRAHHLFKRNKDYMVQSGQVIIIDTYTGRLMPGRRWSDGLHQSVEAKEGVKVQGENITHATITIQNYFRMYGKLSGMTGTAMTEAEEFDNIYKLEVLAIPPNVEYNSMREDSLLVSLKAKDEYSYEFTYYAQKEDPEKTAVFWKRKDYPDVVFRTKEAKLRATVQEIISYSCVGRPILVGTTSVKTSEHLGNRLKGELVRKMLQTLLLRKVWMIQNDREEDGRTIMALSFLNEPLESIDGKMMRDMAKDLNISLTVNQESNLPVLLEALNLQSEHQERLIGIMQKGISHQVLNARKHTEESQIIAGAGAFGAVTIATNMAGRGVDIKLGGEIAEEILTAVHRVLKRGGHQNTFDLSAYEKFSLLKTINEEHFGIYEAEINFFIQSMENMGRVKELGGLHVIGSERHEARRIDNQLRGRAARQGDPGSSRFFLSMEDDLMRLFGGQQMDSMMQRLGMDDAMPLELGLVSKIIEQAQSRVEGNNFDSRKHLLEYDDVLNSQRKIIYDQRDKIFVKEDLSEDVSDMLSMEIERRIPIALMDEEGPWKLLMWLDEIQPAMQVENELYASFTYQILLEEINKNGASKSVIIEKVVSIVNKALTIEHDHLLLSIENALDQNLDRLEEQIKDRLDTLDIFFEGLNYPDETDNRSSKEIYQDLISTVQLQINYSNSQQQLMLSAPDEAYQIAKEQLEKLLKAQYATRMVGVVERRLLESLGLSTNELAKQETDEIAEEILSAVKIKFTKRHERWIGENNTVISQHLQSLFSSADDTPTQFQIFNVLQGISLEERVGYNKITHKQQSVKIRKFNYVYYVASLIDDVEEDELTDNIIEHLSGAQEAIIRVWGLNIWDSIAEIKFEDLEPKINQLISRNLLGPEIKMLGEAERDNNSNVVVALGNRQITETHRQLILRVISELWVEYITQMEALRVSIGLEAYGQRDPLVQYKGKASEMFQQLFADMRMSMVTRMFTFRPRQQSVATMVSPTTNQQTPPQKNGQPSSGKKKRRRRRR
jgi:preprotein translocase subunit SecA